MYKKAFKNDLESQLLINIFVDNELKFTHLANPLSTLEDLKQTILLKTSHYSINYKMEYNEVEVSCFPPPQQDKSAVRLPATAFQ